MRTFFANYYILLIRLNFSQLNIYEPTKYLATFQKYALGVYRKNQLFNKWGV